MLVQLLARREKPLHCTTFRTGALLASLPCGFLTPGVLVSSLSISLVSVLMGKRSAKDLRTWSTLVQGELTWTWSGHGSTTHAQGGWGRGQ